MNHADIAPDVTVAETVPISRAELRQIVSEAIAEAIKGAGFDGHKKQSPPKVAYSLREAASVSAVGRTSLYLAIRRGELRALKKGARTIVLDRDLRRWLEGLPPSHV